MNVKFMYYLKYNDSGKPVVKAFKKTIDVEQLPPVGTVVFFDDRHSGGEFQGVSIERLYYFENIDPSYVAVCEMEEWDEFDEDQKRWFESLGWEES